MTRIIYFWRTIALFMSCASLASIAHAAIFSTSISTVAWVDSYPSFGGGDVVFALKNNSLGSACPYGFWIRATDTGAKNAVAQLVAALQTGSAVVVWADTAAIWTGSNAASCLVQDLRVMGR